MFITYLIMGLVGVLVILLLVAFIFQKTKSSSQREVDKLKKSLPSRKRRPARSNWGLVVYKYINNIPGLGNVLNMLEQRMKALSLGSEREIKNISAKYTTYAVGILILFFSLSMVISNSVGTRFAMTLTGIYAATILFDFMISRMEMKSLESADTALNKIKDHYQNTKMTTVSLERAADDVNELAATQLRAIVKVWRSSNPDDALEDYYTVAPNDHMRKLAGVGRSVAIFGDGDEGESQFLDGVTKIIEDVRNDILKRKKIDSKTSGFKFMAIFPVFGIEPIKDWCTTNIPESSWFFSSKLGLYSLVLVYLSIIISFVGSSLTRVVSSGNRATMQEGKYLKVILKSAFFRRMVERVAPTDGESARSARVLARYEPLLKRASSGLSVRELYLNKIIYCLLGFILILGVQIGTHYLGREAYLDRKAFTEKANTTTGYYALEKRKYEAEVLAKYGKSEASREEILAAIENDPSSRRYAAMDRSVENYPEYLLSKIYDFRDQTLKWYDLVYAIAAGFVFFFIPDLLLYIRASLRSWEMQSEVDGFYTNLLILTKNRRIMVKDLLEWMYRYSSIFSAPLLRAMVTYNKGSWIALERLKEDCAFEPMENIVERLKAGVNSTTLYDAFSDLEGQREYALEKKKIADEESIEKRGKIAAAFGWTPIFVLLITHLGLPFGIMMYDKFIEISTVTNTLG